jgi:hypothetical protein
MNCRECEDLIVEALYGELDEEARVHFDAHVESCAGCAETYAKMQSTLRVMDEREQPDPGQAYWDGYYNRITARMEREEAERRSRGWLGRLFPGLSQTGVRWAYRGVMAAVLIVFGAVAGRMIMPGQETETTPGTGIVGVTAPDERDDESSAPVIQPASAESCARQYIEDSQVLLLALVNFDPETEGEYMADWSSEKNRSRELVNQAASIKADLDDPKQRRLRNLVTELELIMLQIANLESMGDMDAVDLIRSSVDDKDVMLKINLEKMRGGEVAEPDPGECDA